jgi:superfamily II DNA or RNA helicase
MSISIDHASIPPETLKQFDTDLHIRIDPKTRFQQVVRLEPFRLEYGRLYVPFAYGISKHYFPQPHPRKQIQCAMTVQLRPAQLNVKQEAISTLNKTRSILLSTHVGFGKTVLAIALSHKIGMKTMIIVSKVILMKQWKESLEQFLDAPKIQCLTPKKPIELDNEFFIVNAINVVKFGDLPEIGTVIVDECHLIMSKVFSESLQYLTPSYMIGLSATPYRTDGLDVLLDLYFGTHRIHIPLNRPHTVKCIKTGFVPEVEYAANGTVNWNSVLESQATCPKRNAFIVELIQSLSEYNVLVLCKRVSHITTLESLLKEAGVSACSLHGTKNEYDPSIKVLIGTIQKVGTGFDAPHLNALLVASDVENFFIQYLGRVFRKPDVVPVIFDLVDDHFLLLKHFKSRKKVYKQHGGTIINDH